MPASAPLSSPEQFRAWIEKPPVGDRIVNFMDAATLKLWIKKLQSRRT